MTGKLIKQFREFVARERLFTKDDRLLLACSGGLDSTVLAHLLHAEGYEFAIAHMNFQLRGEASNGDAAFVEELARTLGAKFYCQAVDVKQEAQPGESTQMTCRRLRYDWFYTVKELDDFRYLLTAHHLDDNVETLLINFIRGTGIDGLAGMKPQLGHLVRPLLETPLNLIKAYAQSNTIPWREDASNQTDDYLRNRVRHQLTPVLRKEFGLSDKALTSTFTNLRGAASMNNAHLKYWKSKVTNINGAETTIERREVELVLSYAEKRALLWNIIKAYGFTVDQIDQIIKSKSGKFYDATDQRLYVTDEHWTISPSPDSPPLERYAINELPNGASIGKAGLIELQLIPRPTALHQPGALYLAPPTFPLHLRPRKNGDRFQPLGLGGKTKKVKDYFIDEKVPVWLRDRIYLLTDANDEIMAIPGYCISEQFKVLPEHNTVLRITTH